MADQRVNINIGSSYNGEGMSKALAGVEQLSKTSGKVAGAIGRLGGQFEAFGGTAGKAIGNVSNLMGALAAGGLWGGITAGITTAIALFQDAFAMMDEMKKRAEENAKEWKKAEENAKKWIQAIQENELNNIQQHGEKLIATLNRLAAAEAKVTAAQNQLNEAMGQSDFAQLQADIAGRVNAASSPDEKARERAAGNVRLAEAQKEMIAEAQKAIVEQKRVALENAKAVELNTRATIEAAEAASGLKADHTKLEIAIKAREEAELQLSIAEEKQKTAAIKSQTDIDNAKAAQRELIAAQREAAGQLLQEAADKARRAEAEKDIAEIQENAAEEIKRIDNEIKDAKEDLKAAIKHAADAYNAANPNLRDIYDNASGDNAEALRRRMSSSSNWGTGREYNEAKAERWARTHGDQLGGLSQKEQREYDELAGKWAGGNELSKSQRQRLRELAEKDPQRKAQKAQEAAQKAQERLEALQKKREEAEKQMRADVKAIKDKMEALGLK